MDRINIYITTNQLVYLKCLEDKTVSEHIRKAIDDYIEKIEKQKVSNSPSKHV